VSIKFIPTILKHHYEAFRKVLGRDLPDTYNEWLYLTNKRSLENAATGNISQAIEVDPNEFVRYQRATGASTDLHSLDNFTYEKGMGNKY
jgi:hypothetical protein